MKKIIFMPKLLIAYLWYLITGPFIRGNIALVSEKPDEARDNGFYFFRYSMENNNVGKIYYIIEKGSPDYSKIEIYKKNVIFLNSLKHYYYYFLSNRMITSQSYPYPISKKLCKKYFPCRSKKLFWLQHGVTKDYDIVMDYSNSDNVSFCSCSSAKEQDFFVNRFHYPRNVACNTGFCRFDGLVSETDDTCPQILIMPTFRRWLTPANYKNPTEVEIEKFKKSAYFNFYMELLNSDKVIDLLERNNANVIFYLHYAFQPYADLFFSKSNRIQIAKKNVNDVQQLMKKSDLMITDFSSVAFDFAYMNKPLIYAHFDYEEYREYHYGEGYFSYVKDGFGLVTYNQQETIKEIETIFENNFKVDNMYVARTNAFFDLRDMNNCKRNFEKVFKDN